MTAYKKGHLLAQQQQEKVEEDEADYEGEVDYETETTA